MDSAKIQSLSASVLAMRDAGWTFREISKELRITENRARQLWNRAHSNREIPRLIREIHAMCLETLAILREFSVNPERIAVQVRRLEKHDLARRIGELAERFNQTPSGKGSAP
jgi:orotate phosphoribosyltransferase-like protein